MKNRTILTSFSPSEEHACSWKQFKPIETITWPVLLASQPQWGKTTVAYPSNVLATSRYCKHWMKKPHALKGMSFYCFAWGVVPIMFLNWHHYKDKDKDKDHSIPFSYPLPPISQDMTDSVAIEEESGDEKHFGLVLTWFQLHFWRHYNMSLTLP